MEYLIHIFEHLIPTECLGDCSSTDCLELALIDMGLESIELSNSIDEDGDYFYHIVERISWNKTPLLDIEIELVDGRINTHNIINIFNIQEYNTLIDELFGSIILHQKAHMIRVFNHYHNYHNR